MIKQFASMIKSAVKAMTSEKVLECAIDDEVVDCESLEAPIQECGPGHFTQGYGWIGVPAPAVLQDDPWFGPAPISDANQDYMEQETLIKQQEHQETHSVESEDIHQVMYEMATSNLPFNP